MRKRTSIIWQLPDDEFSTLIRNSRTMSEVLRTFGLMNKGNNYQSCHQRIQTLGLDTSHFLRRTDASNLRRQIPKETFLARLCRGSRYDRKHIKRYLLKFNLLPYVCARCGNTGIWNKDKLVLQLEHKNGVNNDNRLENLEYLCPNCHSQTSTFAGKHHQIHYLCSKCGQPCKGYSSNHLCISCARLLSIDQHGLRVYARPSKEELESMLKNFRMSAIVRHYNVRSHATIKKWAMGYQLDWRSLNPYTRSNRKSPTIES